MWRRRNTSASPETPWTLPYTVPFHKLPKTKPKERAVDWLSSARGGSMCSSHSHEFVLQDVMWNMASWRLTLPIYTSCSFPNNVQDPALSFSPAQQQPSHCSIQHKCCRLTYPKDKHWQQLGSYPTWCEFKQTMSSQVKRVFRFHRKRSLPGLYVSTRVSSAFCLWDFGWSVAFASFHFSECRVSTAFTPWMLSALISLVLLLDYRV
jgi:hypothetical protein